MFLSQPQMPGQIFPALFDCCRAFGMWIILNDCLTLNHCLCKDRIKRDPAHDGHVFFFRISLDGLSHLGIEVILIDTDHGRDPEEGGQLRHPLHVVPARNRGLGHDERCRGPAKGGNYRTTDARRTVR